MGLLTRDAILQVQDLKYEDVPVPEWGGQVRVRMMTGAERDAIGARLQNLDKAEAATTYRLLLAATCMVGEDGAALFGFADLPQLAAKSQVALDRVCEAAQRLNTLAAADIEAAQGN